MPKEFLVNTYAGQWQEHPDVARLAGGSIVVVWDSYFSEDGLRTYYIAMQRFSANGTRIGGEEVLAAFTNGQSTHPSVAALKDGGFAVAWQIAAGESILGQDDVYTNTFDADGTARGDATRAHPASKNDQFAASITATDNGGFALTWSSYDGPKTGKQDEIYFRRYDADGDAIGEGQKVNQVQQFDQHNSRITRLSNGNLLVAWDAEYGGDPTPSGVEEDGVRARLYSQKGKALGQEFLLVGQNDGVNGGVNITESRMDVAALPDDQFVVTWYETVLHKDRDTTFEIHAQIYRNDGAKAGSEILVRGGSVSTPDHSAVIALEGGGFAVAWDAFGKRTYAFEEVYARVYDENGRATGRAFLVNPPSGRSAQDNPELLALDGGGFMVVYESEYLDGDDDAIAGRIFRPGSFGADLKVLNGAATVHAFTGNDTITGSDGADALFLGRGRDTALAGAGDDLIRGGRGADRLSGGAGADTFVYATAAHSRVGAADVLLDFESGQDHIDLSRLAARTGTAFAWIGDATFSGTAGELRFADGCLSADLDGDRAADFVIKVTGDSVVAGDLLF